jgi:sulfur carrier protein
VNYFNLFVMIEVSINQQKFQISDSGTLADVLPLLQIRQADGIAIALNETVIPKGEWEGHVLHAQDRVFVIRATQGG